MRESIVLLLVYKQCLKKALKLGSRAQTHFCSKKWISAAKNSIFH